VLLCIFNYYCIYTGIMHTQALVSRGRASLCWEKNEPTNDTGKMFIHN